VRPVKIYTRKGDDGSTGLLHGGRVPKQSAWPTAYGAVDEAQAFLGVARAAAGAGAGELDELLIGIERDLWVLMAELATDPDKRDRLQDGATRVTEAMVVALEEHIDAVSGRFEPPTEFVVPGETLVAAHLDVARTVVRRAERDVLRAYVADGIDVTGTHAVAYLNRLSDLVWTMARWQEGASRLTRPADPA
jgi:cob(I)alamin adenosyltransferase